MRDRLVYIDVTTFKETFESCVNAIVKRGYSDYDEFQFTPDNRNIINQLYLHLIQSPKFTQDLNKNIMIIGGYGTGKTTIMTAFKQTIEFNTIKRVTMFNMNELNGLVKQNGLEYYYKRPVIMDEIGREEKSINDYGTKIYPSMQLLEKRYSNKAWTWACGNFTMNELSNIYGPYMYQRIYEMFNVFEMQPVNYRPKENKPKQLEL